MKSGYGHALIREGSELEDGVVTRPVAGVSWTVDSALISQKSPSQKTIPLLVRELIYIQADSIGWKSQESRVNDAPFKQGKKLD